MQFVDIFCYLLLTVTTLASTSYVDAESEYDKNHLSENKTEKRISKREASLFVFPIEPVLQQRPKVIYRRISKQRQSPKPKYGKTKYRSVKPWTSTKKYRTDKPKYGPRSFNRYTLKPKYGRPKTKIQKLVYGSPKNVPLSSFYPPESVGFAEPPLSNTEFQLPKQTFGEPPIDSYGEPVKATVNDLYLPEQYQQQTTKFPNRFIEFNDHNSNSNQEYKSWQSYQIDHNHNIDNSVAYSKRRPVYVEPDLPFVSQDEDFDLKNPYSHRYKHKEFNFEQEPVPFEKKFISLYHSPKIAKPQRSQKLTSPEAEEILVGGRYAEPPERYVPKLTIAKYSDDNDFTPLKGYIDPDIATSATMSPYVNYKHSNMAFSPQNLNDAFSIIDK